MNSACMKKHLSENKKGPLPDSGPFALLFSSCFPSQFAEHNPEAVFQRDAAEIAAIHAVVPVIAHDKDMSGRHRKYLIAIP